MHIRCNKTKSDYIFKISYLGVVLLFFPRNQYKASREELHATIFLGEKAYRV